MPGGARANGLERAIQRVLPRVVKLYGAGTGLEAGFGSGILVSADGLVLTVYSLLIEGHNVRAIDAKGRSYAVRVVSVDPDRQLALLRLRVPEGDPSPTFPYFDLRGDVPLQPGDWVLAAGNAFKVAHGSEPVSLTHGVFSIRTQLDARRRMRDFPYHGDVLVIDAITSNPGAPGGAVVNLDGELVGMIGREVVSNYTHTHFNYAIPRDVLLDFYREARKQGETPQSLVAAFRKRLERRKHASERPDSGIRLSRIGYRQVLPFVERVVRGSPAERAGVRKDDLILSVNGRSVSDVEAFEREMKRVPPGHPVHLLLRRGRKLVDVRIEFSDAG